MIVNVKKKIKKKILISITKMVQFLSSIGHVNLDYIVNKKKGILQWQNSHISGEKYFLEKILPEIILRGYPLTLFDIGAHDGKYTEMILESLPEGNFHCFEPNAEMATRLRFRFNNNKNVFVNQQAVGESCGRLEIFDYPRSLGSTHASVYQLVISELHGSRETESYFACVTNIDSYCKNNNIEKISFLKLDIEGHEIHALRGAQEMIKASKIDIIQFEFNEMNVASRVFLRDFYEILKGYSFYRIRWDGLIPLGSYHTGNEIFQYQNIVAVRGALVDQNLARHIVRSVW